MPSGQTEHFEKPFVFRRLSMDALADVLIDEIHAEVRESALFRRTQVIVPNRSIQRYLSLRFAQRYGIAAQLEFPLLMSVVQRFLPRTCSRPEIGEKTIGWRIYRILGKPESGKVFPSLTQWMKDDPKRLYDLSRQLGSLYDKYMLYRPWWINDWEAGRMPHGLDGEPSAAWQGELWRRIVGEDWKGNHFAAAFDRIVRNGEPAHTSGEGDGTGGETIRIFGFSQLPPTMLECLERLAGLGTTVKLYHLVPSGEFYADCRKHKDELREFLDKYFHEGQDPVRLLEDMNTKYFQHNPLLASFAMQSRILLNRTSEWMDDAEFDDSGEDGLETGTVLHRLQRRIRADRKPDGVRPGKLEKGNACRSVQIRSCYSAFREVEAAHNFILHCLDEDHGLPLKDIFIMTPSPADYAPLVDAVFNHSGDARLGVSIADQPQTERLSSYSTMMKILSLFKGDFAASEIFGILQDQSLQKHWEITPEDCLYCLIRAMQAGIRWGWDATEHKLSGGKEFPENSWQAGFDRMLLDYAVDADPASPYRLNDEDPVFPVPGFDGSRAELLGKFISLVSNLHEITQAMRKWEKNGVPFREWEKKLAETAGVLFGKDSELKILLLSVLNTWRQVLAEAGAEDVPLTSGIVLAHLQDKHAKPEDNTVGFMRGKITFCGLRPMRSIPADAILLLGMNHKSFPEEDDDREFDIMQQLRQGKDSMAGREPGDPLKRDESRQLFLDTIMAARKYLYISYVGRDIHDRKEKPPSVCVDELRTYLTQTFGKNSFVDIQEPIHSFSPELFRDGTPNQSFSDKMRKAAEQIANPAEDGVKLPLFHIRPGLRMHDPAEKGTPQDEDRDRRVEFGRLVSFFRNPAGTFVQDGLNAAVSVFETASSEDSEMFEGKLPWDVKENLLDLYLETDEADRAALKTNCLQRLKTDGVLPLALQEDTWQEWSEIAVLAHETETLTQAGAERIPAEERAFTYTAADAGETAGALGPVPDGAFRDTLALPELKVYQTGDPDAPLIQVIPCLGEDISGAQRIEPVLRHLRANLSRKVRTRIVFIRNRNAAYLDADAMECADAENAVKRLLYLFRAGLRVPLPFFPKSSYELFRTGDAESAESVWNGGGNPNAKGEKEKFRAFFGEDMPVSAPVGELAAAFFGSAVFHEVKGGPA
ncbi:MAG: exodeoxyribonuclease V subunit gamma [Lentisphaeria bacterium]|nr:exodeoxyribonuclease V subunit gamma [Lentisphaeria bacterium]